MTKGKTLQVVFSKYVELVCYMSNIAIKNFVLKFILILKLLSACKVIVVKVPDDNSIIVHFTRLDTSRYY